MKTIHLAIILVFVVSVTSSSVFAQNTTNSTNSIPSNAIRTPNGGWITPLQTTNSSGGKLNMHVEKGVDVSGKIIPPPVTANMESPQQFQTPLQQFKSGIKAEDVKCSDGLQLVIKREDGSPACVHPSTIPKLMVRGWLGTTSLDQNNILSGNFYPGIENESGYASIKNQTYYIMTLSDHINSTKTIQFHGVIFSFPYSWLVTPGGGLLPVTMTFPDGLTESFGYDKRKPDGSGALSGLGLGPGPSSNRTVTIFSNHIGPKAGVTLTEDEVKLLVSSDTISSNSSRPVNATLPASFMPCDTPFTQSNNGITVLYMPVNSIGKICVRYFNPNESKNASLTIFDASSYKTAKSITSWAEPSMIPTGNSTVRFSVKTGNQTGFYGLQIFCSGMPFAVGYDAKSNFTLNDFPWEKSPTISCPLMTYQYKIDSLSGIGVGYIPYP